MHEGEAGVGGAESRQGAALGEMGEPLGSRDGGQPDHPYPSRDFRNGFSEDNDPEGGRGVIGGLAGLVQDHPIRRFQLGGVVAEQHQGERSSRMIARLIKLTSFHTAWGTPLGPGAEEGEDLGRLSLISSLVTGIAEGFSSGALC